MVHAMQVLAFMPNVQKHGCDALHTLALHADNRAQVALTGGIEVVIAAMRAHPSLGPVQKMGSATHTAIFRMTSLCAKRSRLSWGKPSLVGDLGAQMRRVAQHRV